MALSQRVARHRPLERAETGVIRLDPRARRIAVLQHELVAAHAENDPVLADRARAELAALQVDGDGVAGRR